MCVWGVSGVTRTFAEGFRIDSGHGLRRLRILTVVSPSGPSKDTLPTSCDDHTSCLRVLLWVASAVPNAARQADLVDPRPTVISLAHAIPDRAATRTVTVARGRR